jgi:capsular polysaccharide biosynthesis protein
MATVAPDASAYEIQLDIRHPDPAVAVAISRTWAERFIQERERANLELDQSDRTLVRLRDETTQELWAPKKAVNTGAGLVLGALVGLAAVYGVWWLRRRAVRTADEARRATGLPLVGTIPRPPRRAAGRGTP